MLTLCSCRVYILTYGYQPASKNEKPDIDLEQARSQLSSYLPKH